MYALTELVCVIFFKFFIGKEKQFIFWQFFYIFYGSGIKTNL